MSAVSASLNLNKQDSFFHESTKHCSFKSALLSIGIAGLFFQMAQSSPPCVTAEPMISSLPESTDSTAEIPPTTVSLEETEQILAEAMVNRIQRLVQVSQAGSESGNFSGIHYPTTIPVTHPSYEKWKKTGVLLSGSAPNQFFDEIPQEGFPFRITMHFIAKKDVTPSEAVEAAMQGPTIGECGMAVQLARYAALLDVLTKPKFDKLFSTPGHRINIGYARDDESQPMRLFVDFTKRARERKLGSPNKRPVKIGQIVLFQGVNNYHDKHPYGVGGSLNTICINATNGAQRFTNLRLNPKGVSEAEIGTWLLNGYNQDADHPFSLFPGAYHAYLRAQNPRQASLKKHKATKALGYDPGSPQGFKLQVVQELINAPLSEVTMDRVMQHSLNAKICSQN